MNLTTDFLYAFIRMYREFYLYASSSAEWEIGYIKRSVIIYDTSEVMNSFIESLKLDSTEKQQKYN